MEKETAIKIENLSKTFKIPHEKHTSLKSLFLNIFNKKGYTKLNALKGLNLEIRKGEFFGIIGDNGSGKSTLLKILAGIYQADEGKIKISGKISPFLELGVGFNPELTARDNIFLGGAILGLTRNEVANKFDKIVEFAGLEKFIDLKFKNFSSGMQVRLAFSLAINAQAEVLLMDEVLAVGDSNFQMKCLEEFNRYREQGKTVVLVSHDIASIQRYCDRAMLLENGKVKKIGQADAVCNEYVKQNVENTKKERAELIYSEGVSLDHANYKITKVDFLNEKGQSKSAFKTGDNISVRVYFDIKKKDQDINFGVAIYNQENLYCLGVNTINDGVDTKAYLRQGYLQIDYHNMPLRTNRYYIKAGIFGQNDQVIFDFLEKSQTFTVLSDNNNQGNIEIDYKWSSLK
jgi:lipopolysaccharide transport system ATP-binding protein